MMKPAVSIILPTYNGASRGYLAEAIDSVLAQTFTNYQLILIDDGSTDDTASLCKSYLGCLHVEYYRQENKGLSAARNAGIERAQGDYLLFLDDDDVYESQMVEKLWKSFTTNEDPKIGMLYCAYHFIDAGGTVFGRWYIPADGDIYERLFYDNYAGSPSGTMIHKSVIEKVGLFNEALRSCEDYDMWLRIAKHFHVYSIEEPLLRYRIHSNNMSGDILKIETYQTKVLHSALEESPVHIQKQRHCYFHHLSLQFAAKYFEVGDYGNFRRCCDKSSTYQSIGIKWQLKYWISYLSRLTNVLFQAKRYCFSSIVQKR